MKNAKNSFFCFLLFLLSACSHGPVLVEIDNPQHYQEYKRLLDLKNIEYVVVDERTLSVKIDSMDELDDRMADFEEYVKKSYENNK